MAKGNENVTLPGISKILNTPYGQVYIYNTLKVLKRPQKQRIVNPKTMGWKKEKNNEKQKSKRKVVEKEG